MKRSEEYDACFCRLSARAEKGLIWLIACFTVLLVAGQIGCALEPVRAWIVETKKWEGTPIMP